MKENFTMQIPSGRADLYVTKSLAMFRQLGYWHDTNKVYQFVPTNLVGYAILMQRGRLVGERPMKAWVVYRPCALSLSWAAEKVVYFQNLDFDYAATLHEKNPDWWTTIKPHYANAL